MEGENRKLFLILSALFLYLVIGSVIFQALESKVPHLVDEKVKEIHHDFTTKYKYNVSWDKFKADVVDKLKRVYQKNGFAVGEWNFYTSLYFCGSVVTTIGYGHMTPRTSSGRIVVIFYAIFGIPLNIWALKSLGDRITSLIEKLFAKVEKKLKREPSKLKLKVVITMGIINIVTLLLGGYLYDFSEKNWTYLEGVYYCFIVYSTIGFGDLVPNEGHSPGNRAEIAWMFLRALNLMIGLSLLSSLLSSIIQAADEIKVVCPVMPRLRKIGASPKDIRNNDNNVALDTTSKVDRTRKTSKRIKTISVQEAVSSENDNVEDAKTADTSAT